ncbi:unnamed protein product [Prunus armeniaca]|uniref:Uncharacterized protein n=1 Tax=Prunus armeniaca TaxID=36596 RepID=A0A6J5UTE6_PRUAR|nr:unnamed protein product [Prunus armeniaca]
MFYRKQSLPRNFQVLENHPSSSLPSEYFRNVLGYSPAHPARPANPQPCSGCLHCSSLLGKSSVFLAQPSLLLLFFFFFFFFLF